MKLGLIADIHEQNDSLRAAIRRFHSEGVDQIVFIGDAFEMGKRIEETCRLLSDANVIGVWGNHDFGLCVGSDDLIRRKYPSVVIDYMTGLRPRLEIAGCYFAHIEPWLNPEDLADLWYFDGPPVNRDRLDLIFNAVPNRVMFAGHYHQWMLATPNGISAWRGESPIRLETGRYFVVVGAVCEGQFAIFDTETSELRPCVAT